MMRRAKSAVLPMLLPTLLSACGSPPAQDEAGAPVPASVPTTPAPQPQTLAAWVGEYRVAGIDGQSFDEDFGLALRIEADMIVLETCDRPVWVADLLGGVLRVTRLPAERTQCPQPPHPRVVQLIEALDSAEGIRRTPANGVEIFGRGRSVLVFLQ